MTTGSLSRRDTPTKKIVGDVEEDSKNIADGEGCMSDNAGEGLEGENPCIERCLCIFRTYLGCSSLSSSRVQGSDD